MILEAWNQISLAVGDFALGWALRLPRDLTLVVLALTTGFLMIGVRCLTTPQDRLRRAAQDLKRLKQLQREARGDPGARARYQRTRSMISLLKLRAEFWPLLVSLPPIALLATWAVYRLEYLPVKPGEPVELAVYVPAAASGEVMHLVPQEGVAVEGSWVQRIQAVTEDGPPHGLASWLVKAQGDPKPYELVFRWGERSYERDFVVGTRLYAAPVVVHDENVTSQWKREPYAWLGMVSGIAAVGLPAWMIGYVILVVPIAWGLKRLFGVY